MSALGFNMMLFGGGMAMVGLVLFCAGLYILRG